MSTEITIKEVASSLDVSVQRVRTLCREGLISSRKLGTSWFIDAESLSRYVLTSAHKVAQDHPSYEVRRKNKPIALSFFSGAMGLDLGIERAGFDIRLACEVDKYCRQTIVLNKPNANGIATPIRCKTNGVICRAARATQTAIEAIGLRQISASGSAPA